MGRTRMSARTTAPFARVTIASYADSGEAERLLDGMPPHAITQAM
jgi:hypothetical protein